jgi:DNA primase
VLEEFWEYSQNNKSEEAEEYILSRQFSLDDFEWGYFPKTQESINLIKQYSEEFANLKIGFVNKYNGETNSLFYDRLVFPIRDISGKLIAVAGRPITSNFSPPKYYNSKYLKSYNLFYLDKAIPYIRKYNFVLVCEGYFAAFRLHSSGIKNVVATCGTLFTRGQLDSLSRYTTNIAFLRDNDEAGRESTEKAFEKFKNMKHLNLFEIKLTDLENKEDPDDFIVKYGKEKFKELVKKQLMLK